MDTKKVSNLFGLPSLVVLEKNELLKGGESRLAVVVAPGNAPSLSSLGMVCDRSKLFSAAPCNGEVYLDLFYVA